MTSNAQAKLNYIEGTQEAIKAAIESKGVPVGEETTFRDYSEKIGMIATGTDISDADAVAADVVASKTFYATSGAKKTGSMADNGTVSTDIAAKATQVAIAAGKHSGLGIVKISAVEQAKIIAANIKSGITILGVAGNSNVVDTSSGDALSADILSAKKAWVDGSEVTGSLPNRGTFLGEITLRDVPVSVPSGYHSGGTVAISSSDQAAIIPGNIKSGVIILGENGSDNVRDISDANAVAGDVLTTKSFYSVSGGKKMGSMANLGTVSTDISNKTTQVTIAAGKHSGSGIVKIAATEQAKIIPANIKAGITMLAVTGDSNVVDTSSGDAVAGEIIATKKAWVDGLEVIGSMVDRGTINTSISAKATEVTIAAGRHSGSGIVKINVTEQLKIVPENIKSGVTILGVAGNLSGTDISDADAVEADVVASKTFYATSGAKKTGTLTDNGTASTDISSKTTEVTIAAGKHSGSGKVKIAVAEQNKIIPENIKTGVTVLGVTGNLPVVTSDHLVRFIDFDGTILKEQYVASGQNATAPSLPTHSNLTFQEWNNVFTNVTSDIDVGASYITTDGKTYLYVTLTPSLGATANLHLFKNTADLMTINWGDGNTNTSYFLGAVDIAHTYAVEGDYVITITCSGTYLFGNNGAGIIIGSVEPAMITDVRIGSNVVAFESNSFQSCFSLRTISIPSQVLVWSGGNFMDCWSLECVVVPKTIDAIGPGAFYSCHRLSTVVLPQQLLTISNIVFQYCNNLRYIVLPNGLEEIGDSAFDGCSSLESINIPNSVTALSLSCFSQCKALKTVILSTAIDYIPGNCFAYCHSLHSIVLPQGVTAIGGEAFFECESLAALVLPSSLTSLELYCFFNCTALKEMHIPNSVTNIQPYSFSGCSSLKTIEFPNVITDIHEGILSGCLSLSQVSFGADVVSIYDLVFGGAQSIKEFVFNSLIPPVIAESSFTTLSPIAKIYVPDASVADYKIAQYWDALELYIYPLSSKP